MSRTIIVNAKGFSCPPKGCSPPSSKGWSSDILPVNLTRLSHHLWLAKYDMPPRRPRWRSEYFDFLTDDADFRFLEDGVGADTETRRNISNELGKAMARWFGSEHLGVTRFVP